MIEEKSSQTPALCSPMHRRRGTELKFKKKLPAKTSTAIILVLHG